MLHSLDLIYYKSDGEFLQAISIADMEEFSTPETAACFHVFWGASPHLFCGHIAGNTNHKRGKW